MTNQWTPGATAYKLGAVALGAATLSQYTPYIGTGMNTASPSQTTAASDAPSHAWVEVKLEAVEARTDTKFAQLLGKIDVLTVSISNLSTQVGEAKAAAEGAKTAAGGAKAYIIATGIAIAGTVIGLLAYGTQMFDLARSLAGIGK